MTAAETIADLGPDRLVRLGFAFRESKTLLSAIELDVFTALSTHGPLGLDDLALRTGVHPRGARDFFDTLVSLRLLERDDAGHYRPTPETGRYLDRNSPYYIGGELEFASARQFGPWSLFTEALRTGKPQSGARGTENYSAYYAQAVILENVAKGMSGGTLLAAEAMAERFPWREYQTLCDVGTAQGCLPVASPAPTVTSTASASICRRCSGCSRNMSASRGWPTDCASRPAISSRTLCRRPMSW